MIIQMHLGLHDLRSELETFTQIAGPKLLTLERFWRGKPGAPVFTRRGHYTSRGWTEWTQGFLYGSRILFFDLSGEEHFLDSGRRDTLYYLAPHITHMGVHDHGFTILSTYGNLRRLAYEELTQDSSDLICLYELALRLSGAVQAARWTATCEGGGFIYSFNGPHSLFVDTMRSCRILVLAHLLGHVLKGENDVEISLLDRAVKHIRTTLKYAVYYGKGRDLYDVRGRVAHESLFNINDGCYRCPSTQQGYSPFTTWTRGLAWALLGCAEQLEAFHDHPHLQQEIEDGTRFLQDLVQAATAVADYFIDNTCADGIPFWDTGAPNVGHLGDYWNRPSEPSNPFEPVDSSAAVIAAQGLLRLGQYLGKRARGKRYFQAGLTLARTLFRPPYLSTAPNHHGLILHSVYHRPNGWDYVRPGQTTPWGESSLWGDYHALELAVYLQRLLENRPYLTFYGCPSCASR